MLGNSYILTIFLMGIAFFTAGIIALYWAFNSGQFKNFEKNARVIFNEEEPEGVQTDFFPGDHSSSKKTSPSSKI